MFLSVCVMRLTRMCDVPDCVCDAPDMGIAGFVAETGEAYKAEEAYADARYHAKFDRAWSFQVVHNMCCETSLWLLYRDTSVTDIETPPAGVAQHVLRARAHPGLGPAVRGAAGDQQGPARVLQRGGRGQHEGLSPHTCAAKRRRHSCVAAPHADLIPRGNMQVYSKQLGIVLQDFGACAGGRMFAAIDVDNSGFISLDELRGAMRAENPSVTEAQVLKP